MQNKIQIQEKYDNWKISTSVRRYKKVVLADQEYHKKRGSISTSNSGIAITKSTNICPPSIAVYHIQPHQHLPVHRPRSHEY